MEKRCFKCGKTKPIEEFYRHPLMGDGHLGKCKLCTKLDVNKRYYSEEGRKKIRAYERARFKTRKRKINLRRYALKRREIHPDKYKAHYILTNAVRDGRIVRKPCEVCGDAKSQGHHADYKKPLSVRWLCFKHHREYHGQIVDL